MNVPWTCPACAGVTLIDLQNLDVRPVNKIVNKIGYQCTCGEFVEIRCDSGNFRELAGRLERYTPVHEQYQFLLRKLIHKAVNMMDKDYN